VTRIPDTLARVAPALPVAAARQQDRPAVGYPRPQIEPAPEPEPEFYDGLGRLLLHTQRVGPPASRTVLLTRAGEPAPATGMMVLLSAGLLRTLLASARALGPRRRGRRSRRRLDIRI